jgi:hypothetical protein
MNILKWVKKELKRFDNEYGFAVITHGGTLPDSSQKSDFYAIIDDATVAGIVNADISNSAAIAPTKLAQITTASKVAGTALTGLTGIPSGAGVIPAANLPLTPIKNGSYASSGAATVVVAHGCGVAPKMILVQAPNDGTGLWLGLWIYGATTMVGISPAYHDVAITVDATNFTITSSDSYFNKGTLNQYTYYFTAIASS